MDTGPNLEYASDLEITQTKKASLSKAERPQGQRSRLKATRSKVKAKAESEASLCSTSLPVAATALRLAFTLWGNACYGKSEACSRVPPAGSGGIASLPCPCPSANVVPKNIQRQNRR